MNGQFVWSPGQTIEMMKREFVANALKFYGGNEQSAANSLGIPIPELKEILVRSHNAAGEQDKVDAQRKKDREVFLARSRGLVHRDPETQMDMVLPFPAGQVPSQPSEGLDPSSAAAILAGRPTTPETALPVGPVLGNVGDPPVTGSAAEAAARTKMLLEESGLK